MNSAIFRNLKSFCSRKEPLILNYHSIISLKLPFSVDYHLYIKDFEDHLKYLKSHYNCMHLEDLIKSILCNKIRKHSIAITFDDGYHNNLSNALPLLEKYEIPATIFVVTGSLGNHNLLWPEILAASLFLTKSTELTINNENFSISTPLERYTVYKYITRFFKTCDETTISRHIKTIQHALQITTENILNSKFYDEFKLLDHTSLNKLYSSELITIGSHTVNHKRLSNTSSTTAWHEIYHSKETLEKLLGNVEYFAYPFGIPERDFNNTHMHLVKDAGYKAALSVSDRTIIPGSDIMNLPRTNILAHHHSNDFKYIVDGGIAYADGFNFLNSIKGLFTGVIK